MESHPKDDPRTVDELVNTALSETDEEVAWRAMTALHWRGTREVLAWCEALCRSQCSRERRLAADILGQLGVPDRTFPRETGTILRGMLRANAESEVLQAALVALSFQHDSEIIPAVIGFSVHPDPEVRHATVLALTGHEAPPAIECLISLSRDADARVRDWATFALGTQLEIDTPQIRDALAERLTDPDDDTRGEALVGLASRKDRRVIPALQRELSVDLIGSLSIEAAELIGSPELHAPLVALRAWWDVDPMLLDRAISASAT